MKFHLKFVFALLAVMAFSTRGFSADASSLKPPPGAKVAIVMFEDLECPDCARAYPVVWDAANAHHIPVVLHDFPLSKHPWSFEAAIFARFFDTKSQKLGNDFRGYIYQNQPQITRENLQQYVQKFADQNKVPLPFAVDPEGKLKEKVQADYALGQRIGLEHTPTIFVVGSGGPSTPFVEVVDRNQLTQIIEDMQKKAGPATPEKRASAKVRKKPS
ncbi:MAG TPA: thioredoxin domain-containing protein [Candidatus Angelobacter sp.]|nr:thioredoxin domain-containing protein [Candidatus Angelobacter sp.]